MNTYYATCDNNGLISARIEAESVREANAILALQCPVYADRAPSDLEDEIEGLPSDYDAAMAIVAERCTLVSPGSNVHGDWQIWTVNPVDASDDIVTLESMPEHLRASHRAAGNWGVYPVNGAIRERMSRADAEWEIEHDDDGYAHIVA